MSLDQYKAQANKQLDQIDATLLQNDYAKLIHSKVPVRPSFLALGVTSFTLLFMVWGFGASFVANLIGFVYPLYASFESLQQPRNSAQSQQEKWLVYWVTFGTFSLVESMTDFFLYWIPLYHVAKVAFLVWCFAPQTNGANVLYKRIIEPLLIKYESSIDSASVKGRRAADRVTGDIADEIGNQLSGQASTLSKKHISEAASSLLNQTVASNKSESEPKKAQ